MGFEFLDHTADVQVHVWGKTLEEAFEQAVIGTMSVMTDVAKINPIESINVEAMAPDKEMLLVDYLSEFLYIFDVKELIFSRVKVSEIGFNEEENKYIIKSVCYGEKADPSRHLIDTEVKAVTFSYLRIVETSDKSEIWFVLDL